MNILYLGDIMAETGIEVVERVLPGLRRERQIDLVIAQVENVTKGKGISPADFQRLQQAGVDFGTGGNWSLFRDAIIPAMGDPARPIIRPANYPDGTPGLGWKYAKTAQGDVLVISLLGGIVGRDADKPVDNPLLVLDGILAAQADVPKVGIVVNFHGDFSSEKVVIGHYLDGKATLVVGDHWHIATADARILPGGTAHMTDVGMCGSLDSSLGVTYGSVIPRWRDGKQTRNTLETTGAKQFNAVLVQTSTDGLATSVEHIRRILT